jgi:hypothetical protein
LASADSNWIDRFKLKGDFRYRYEYIDDEKSAYERHRNRIRLRVGIHGKVNDTVDVGTVIASGSEDPVSTNQTLDSQSNTKDIRLDQAYFAWKPISGLKIKGGKFKNPFYQPIKTELLWDVDLRPEGLALQYSADQFFVNAGFFHIEERKKEDDSFLFGGQAGYKMKSKGVSATLGAGYFNYTEIKDRQLSDFDFLEEEDDSFGNTLADDQFITDYNELELFGDVTFKGAGLPISLFFDYVINTVADDNDTGYLVGFKVNKAKKPGSWDFRYNYREIEADAVFGALSDSDFRGGGTDGKGHELNFGYQLAKGWKLAASYFINQKDLEKKYDFDRIMVDLKFKF